jgi:hypothetical protein
MSMILGDAKQHKERGKVRHKYHQRKIVWDLIATLVHACVMAHVAINHMQLVYRAKTTVTRIIKNH